MALQNSLMGSLCQLGGRWGTSSRPFSPSGDSINESPSFPHASSPKTSMTRVRSRFLLQQHKSFPHLTPNKSHLLP